MPSFLRSLKLGDNASPLAQIPTEFLRVYGRRLSYSMLWRMAVEGTIPVVRVNGRPRQRSSVPGQGGPAASRCRARAAPPARRGLMGSYRADRDAPPRRRHRRARPRGGGAGRPRGAGSTADLAGVHEPPRLGEPALRTAAGHPERPTDTQEPANT